LKLLRNKVTKKIIDQAFYYEIDIWSDDVINYDLKLMKKGKKINFYSWFNLWFSTFEIISNYIIENNYFEDVQSQGLNINQALARVETVETGLNHKNNVLKTIAKKTNLKKIGKKTLSNAFQKIIAKYTKNKKKKSAIRTLKNNKDLNNILNDIDQLAKEKNIKLLDRKNLEFTIQRKQLDKLKTKNKDEFMVKYVYELLE
jgi:hypothetical protein